MQLPVSQSHSPFPLQVLLIPHFVQLQALLIIETDDRAVLNALLGLRNCKIPDAGVLTRVLTRVVLPALTVNPAAIIAEVLN